MEKEIILVKENNILNITLNRPANKNALTKNMLDELLNILLKAEKDENLRAVFITGSGNAFCAGGDVKNMANQEKDLSPLQNKSRQLRRFMEISKLLHTMPAITVAVISGAVAGAGFSIALACDYRIASKNAIFTTAFAKVGFSGDFGGSYFLTQLVGSAKARELYFFADVISSEKAYELGIINSIVDISILTTEANLLKNKILDSAPIALRYMKKNINIAEKGDLDALLDNEALHHSICGETEDNKNAVIAFRDKKKPTFLGK